MAVFTREKFLSETTEYALRTSREPHVEHAGNKGNEDVQIADNGGLVNGSREANTPDKVGALPNLETLESTTRHKPVRKFAVVPVETSTRSSKKREQDATTTKSSESKEDKLRRSRQDLAVEPLETTAKSSGNQDGKTIDLKDDARPKRRFAPQLVETDTRSSNHKQEENKQSRPRRKFAVEPVETSTSSSRRKHNQLVGSSDSNESLNSTHSGGRRFVPELVGTAKASYRKSKIESAVPGWLRAEIDNEGSWSAPEAEESRFSAKNIAKKARRDPRRHSYNVPDLPMIQSDSSGEESADTEHLDSPHHLHVRREANIRAGNTSYREYLLNLQRNVDMKTLREQAVAAYGDQEDHVPFHHYGGDSEEEEDYSLAIGRLSVKDNADPQLFRRMSHDDLQLRLADVRNSSDQLDKARRDLEADTCGVSRFSAAALAARHHLGIHHPESYRTRHERSKAAEDEELAKMKKAAKPPMAGYDIEFPFSISPKMTRCETDQVPRPRRSNSDDEDYEVGSEELWSAHVSIKHDAPTGLWGGLCLTDDTQPTISTTPPRSGLQTPMWEPHNPFDSSTPRGARTPGTKTPRRPPGMWSGINCLPLTPAKPKHERPHDLFTSKLEQKLALEAQIDAEFPPRVITQIYNYLSLGYPSIARPFDEELSKISRIPIIELRRHDRSGTGTLKGHVGTPEGEGDHTEDDDGRVRGCRRWEALRLYVARVRRTMGTGMWGNNAPVRKGSWGH